MIALLHVNWWLGLSPLDIPTNFRFFAAINDLQDSPESNSRGQPLPKLEGILWIFLQDLHCNCGSVLLIQSTPFLVQIQGKSKAFALEHFENPDLL